MIPAPLDGPDQDALLTVEDAAAFLQVKVSWVYEHVRPHTGDRLPVIRVGKYLRFDRRELRAYIDAKRESNGPVPHGGGRSVQWPPG